jgi:hypothetical protein
MRGNGPFIPFNPLSLSGIQLMLSTRYPDTYITDGAASFDSASSQYLSCASNSTLQTGDVDFWYAGWFYTNDEASYGLWSKYANSGSVDIRIIASGAASYTVSVSHSTGAGQVFSFNSSGTYSVANWHFLFIYHNKTNKTLYASLGNNSFNSYTYTGTLITSTANLILGTANDGLGSPLNGRLDSVAFGKPTSGWLASNATALRDSLYNSGNGKVYTNITQQQKSDWGLISWWDLNESTGTRYDRHGTNHLTASASSPTVGNGIVSGRATTTGDVISQWTDLSGKNNHLVQTNAAQKPTLKLNDVGGLPSIQLDLVDDRLWSSNLASIITGTLIEVTKKGIMVYKAKSGNAYPNEKYFINNITPSAGQQNLVEKVHWNRDLSTGEKNSLIAYYRKWVPTDSWSSVTDFTAYWRTRSDLVEFPVIDTSNGTNFTNTWAVCRELTTFPSLNVSNGTNFTSAWYQCWSLTSFPTLNTGSGTNFTNAWMQCSSLTSFPTINTSSGTNFTSAWKWCTALTSFPAINTSNGTNFSGSWEGCTSLTSFPSINTGNGTNFATTWYSCSSLTSFPSLDVSKGTSFNGTWGYCSSLTSFPTLNTSLGTNFSAAWRDCSGLTNFPLINTSSGTNFAYAWYNCANLTSFPAINTSSGTNFSATWSWCSGLTSFPSLNFNNSLSFNSTWQNCLYLATFPANLFNNCLATDYTGAFINCALTQTSVDNILVSISNAATTYNLQNGTLSLEGGNNATPSATGLSAKSVLTGKGWTVTHN